MIVFACPCYQELGMVTMAFCTVWNKTVVRRPAIIIPTLKKNMLRLSLLLEGCLWRFTKKELTEFVSLLTLSVSKIKGKMASLIVLSAN